ncbi:MAG: TetR/AcrR family transcriptional regulator [Draconibacterium sp.]
MENKRQEIIQHAAALFLQYGIKSVSMDDLARELGMSKRTLYLYVKDKYDVVKSVLAHKLKLFTDLLAVFHDQNANAIEQFRNYSDDIEKNFPKINPSMHYDLRKFYPALLDENTKTVEEQVQAAIIANLKQGMREGFYQPDIDPEVISVLQIIYQNFLFERSNKLTDNYLLIDKHVVEQVYKYHFRGICTTKGIEELKRVFAFHNSNK